MNETKWTQGPWEWADGDLYGAEDAIIRGYSSGDSGTCPNEADRDLIASAPDLYAELVKCDSYIKGGGWCPSCGGRWHLSDCTLVAALAKARGEQVALQEPT